MAAGGMGGEPGGAGEGGAGGDLNDLGASCASGADCESGICVDDVCCDRECDGICELCSAPGMEGVCAFVDGGSDPDDECAAAGVCDGGGYCSSGSHIWSRRVGNDAALQEATDLVVDRNDEVIVVGFFDGTVDFGDQSHSAAGILDGFVAKYGTSNTPVWSQRYASAGAVVLPYAVATDDARNIYVAGRLTGTVDFGCSGALTGSGYFVAKLNSSGGCVFHDLVVDSGGASDEYFLGLAADDVGNAYLALDDAGTLTIGNTDYASSGGRDVFVIKYLGNGQVSWVTKLGDSSHQTVNGIAVDPSGTAYVAGGLNGTLSDSGVTLNANGEDAYVLALDSNGSAIWGERYGDGATQVSVR